MGFQISIFTAIKVKLLIAALKNEYLHNKAVKALSRIGKPAVEPLISALWDWKEENWSLVRQGAAIALGEIGDSRAVKPLISALKDQYVRDEAADALVKIGHIGPLIAALKNWDSQKEIGDILVKIGRPAVEPLITGLRTIDNGGYAGQSGVNIAAFALGKIGGSRAIEPLIVELKHRRSGEAAFALGEIGDTRAVEPLIAALNDKYSQIKGTVAKALGMIGDTRAVEPLIAALKDWSCATQAAEALDKLKWEPKTDTEKIYYFIAKGEENKCVELGSGAVELLIAALNEEDSVIRRSAAKALGMGGHSRAITPLISALRDKSSHVRDNAAEALSKIGRPAVEPLIYVLKDNDADLRNKAVDALSKIGGPAVEPLISALSSWKDEEGGSLVREGAAIALGKIGDSRAVEPLMAALQDNVLRGNAAEALSTIGKPALEPLIAALKDKNWYVQRIAARTLDKLKWEPNEDPPTECLHCHKKITRSNIWVTVEIYPSGKQGALCEGCSWSQGFGENTIFIKISGPEDFKRILLTMEPVVDDGTIELDRVSDDWGLSKTFTAHCPECSVSELSEWLYKFWRLPFEGKNEPKTWRAKKEEKFLRLTATLKYRDGSRAWNTVTVVRTGTEAFKACIDHSGRVLEIVGK